VCRALDKLVAKGVGAFSSNGTSAYFDALLRSKTAVRAGLKAREYKRLLALEAEDHHRVAMLDRPAVHEVRKRLQPPVVLATAVADDGEGSDHSSIAGGFEDQPSVDAGAAPLDGIGAGAEPSVDAGAAPLGGIGAEGLPSDIFGQRVSFLPGRNTATHVYSSRIGVKCSNPLHVGCSKSRSVTLLRDTLGPRCAEAYLGAWLQVAEDVSAAEHAKKRPSLAEQEAYLAAHP